MSTFYVSANATANGNGSIGNPWQLQTAFNHPSALKPGDTVLLRGGVYKGLQKFPDFGNTSFAVRVRGTATAPIIFKAYPKERVIIDNQDPVTPPPYLIGGQPYENNMTIAFFQSTCNDVQLWNCEIRCSSTLSREYNLPRGGIYITAPGIKIINNVIHNTEEGVESWGGAWNNEIYGNIIFHVGHDEPLKTGGHGHGIYCNGPQYDVKPETLKKKIGNNIIHSCYGFNIKAWSSSQQVNNLDFRNNILFNAGTLCKGNPNDWQRYQNFFIVSNNPAQKIKNLVMRNNYTYAGYVQSPKGSCNTIGFNHGGDNIQLIGNYFAGQLRMGTPMTNWNVGENLIWGGIKLPDGNTVGFYGEGPIAQYLVWQNCLMQQEEFTQGYVYYILPNKYEQGTANIVIYNWEQADSITIETAKTGLVSGDNYELINVQDYFNDRITGQISDDGLIEIPMVGHTFTKALGATKQPVSQFPTFGTFVIRKKD